MERPGPGIRVGLVLSGGGARGFAHIGVLRSLERAGAKFDVIAGTSMGAIVGSLYAAGHTPEEIYELAKSTSWRDIIDISLQAGLIKGNRFESFLSAHLPATFEELKLPIAITTTDVQSGEEVVLLEGDLIKAVRASSSFPGAFEPIAFAGRTMADGGIVNNLPIAAATLLGANRVIASDVSPPRHSIYRTPEQEGTWWERMVATVKLERRNPMVQMMLRSSDIMQSILVDIHASLHPPDLRIRMAMPQYRIESFKDFEDIVAIGEQTAEATLAARGGWETCMALGKELEQLVDANGGATLPERDVPPSQGAREQQSTPRAGAADGPASDGQVDVKKTARHLVSAVARAANKRAGKPGRPQR